MFHFKCYITDKLQHANTFSLRHFFLYTTKAILLEENNKEQK